MTETVPTYTAAQVRIAETPLLAAGEPLMRRAAAALATIVSEQVTDAARPGILILAGSGDNGGDALFAAAGLAGAYPVDIVLVADRFHEEALAAALAAGARRVEVSAARDGDYAVIVDGILGIGAGGPLRGTAREVVSSLLPSLDSVRVVAVDLPSGLHPDTGAADDVVLSASVTVTFGAVKAGLVAGGGPSLCGEIVLVDLGLGLEPADAAGTASVARVVPG